MDDLISRKDAIERLRYHADFIRDKEYADGEELLFMDSAIREIEELPSVQPEKAQPTGKTVDADRIKKLAVIESVDLLEPVKSVLPMAVAWIVDKALEEMK